MAALDTKTSQARLGGARQDLTAEGLRLVQDRVALIAKTLFILSLLFYLSLGLVHLNEGAASGRAFVLGPGRLPHLAALAAALLVWMLARRRLPLGGEALAVLDCAVLILPALAGGWMALELGTVVGFYQSVMACVALAVARATLVPSTAVRTLWTTAVAVAPYPAVAWLVARTPQALFVGQAPMSADHHFTQHFIVEAVLWSAITTTAATVISRVIFGLQEQVREARQLGQYTLERKLGEGGMGEVYLARHALLRRPTAIKLIAKSASVGDKQLARFEQEVQQTARLTHPNTIAIYDYGHTPDGVFYYAMEYLDGLDLEQLVAEHGPQPTGRVIHLLRQACGALAEAHEAGLIHRDVKPANIIVCARGGEHDVVKVLDFGLVKEVDGDAALTAENTLTGTPLYMSPEAIKSPERADARSDLYALGAVAYCLLAGRPPFEGDGIVEVCSHHLHTQPEPPSKHLGAPLPTDLEALVLACLAKRPDARPASARELARALAACDDAGSWAADDARAWWREHPMRAKHDSAHGSAVSRTVGVELAGRRVN